LVLQECDGVGTGLTNSFLFSSKLHLIGSSTRPDAVSEGTLWINTTTTINGCVFAPTAPATPVNGMIWGVLANDLVGVMSSATTTDNTNLIELSVNHFIRPMQIKQYVNNTWVGKKAEYYDTEWRVMRYYLFDSVTMFGLNTWSDPNYTAELDEASLTFGENSMALSGNISYVLSAGMYGDAQCSTTNLSSFTNIVGNYRDYSPNTPSINFYVGAKTYGIGDGTSFNIAKNTETWSANTVKFHASTETPTARRNTLLTLYNLYLY